MNEAIFWPEPEGIASYFHRRPNLPTERLNFEIVQDGFIDGFVFVDAEPIEL